jgi:ABC-type transport system involved in multi-copper enzyme maturation permease subunit
MRHLPMGPGLIKALYLLFLEVLIIISLTLMISTIAATAFNVSFGFIVFILGNLVEYLHHSVEHMSSPTARFYGMNFYKLMPNFSAFNVSSYVVLGKDIRPDYIIKLSTYSLIYVFVFLAIAYLIFKRREI